MTAAAQAHDGHGGFLPLFVAVLIITAFPSNFVYYGAPFVILGWGVTGRSAVSGGLLLLLVLSLGLFTLFSLAANHLLPGARNAYGSLLLAGITWAPMLILLAHNSGRWRVNDEEAERVVRLLAGFVILQSMIVAFQMTQTDNWDALSGSYGLLDFMGRITISQVFFTFNIFVINLFLFTYWDRTIARMAVIAGFVAVAAAQSGHQTIFFMATIFLVYASFRDLKLWVKIVASGAFLLGLVLLFFPETPVLAASWAQRILLRDVPKSIVVFEAYEMLGQWKLALLGTGLGQFTSRAALIASGEYIGVALPGFLTGQSSFFATTVSPLLELQAAIGRGSAIAQPYFSLVTLVVELGLLVSALFALWVLNEARRSRRLTRSDDPEVRGLARFQLGFLIFLILCALIENYFEFVQAITLPVLLYIFAMGRIRFCLEQEEALIDAVVEHPTAAAAAE